MMHGAEISRQTNSPATPPPRRALDSQGNYWTGPMKRKLFHSCVSTSHQTSSRESLADETECVAVLQQIAAIRGAVNVPASTARQTDQQPAAGAALGYRISSLVEYAVRGANAQLAASMGLASGSVDVQLPCKASSLAQCNLLSPSLPTTHPPHPDDRPRAQPALRFPSSPLERARGGRAGGRLGFVD